MNPVNEITLENENEVWSQISRDLAVNTFTYNTILLKDNISTLLTIDIDPGSGFAGGYAFTNFSAPITGLAGFKFALHHQDFLDEIGKFFGMQDVIIGYPDFDEKVIVKTNNEAAVKTLLSNDAVRLPWQTLHNFNLHTSGSVEDEGGVHLKLEIEEAISDVEQLQVFFNAFHQVAVHLNGHAVVSKID